jgi:hypothetical protein
MSHPDVPACELPDANPAPPEIREILSTMKTIAVVGLSEKPERDSWRVAAYLQEHGYRVVPVNPSATEILGEKCWPDLASIPFPVDIVDVFRKIDAVPAIVEEAIAMGAKVVWLQLGLAHHASAERTRAAGLRVVQSKCIKIEHMRLF